MTDLTTSTSVAAIVAADAAPAAAAPAAAAPAAAAPAAAAPQPKAGRVILDHPFQRGEQTIDFVDVRKPKSGELRGLQMTALMQSDYISLETLLPRITMPPLTKAEVADLAPADLVQFAGEVMDFLLPKAAKPDFPQT